MPQQFNPVTGQFNIVPSREKNVLAQYNVLEAIPFSQLTNILNGTSTFDCATLINNFIQSVASNGGGEVYFPNGTFCIGSPINWLHKISFTCSAGTTIKALPGFSGGNNASFPAKSLFKCPTDLTLWHENNVFNGNGATLDGNGVAEIGIEFIKERFSSVTQLDIVGCTLNGIKSCFAGATDRSYELRFDDLWIWLKDVPNTANSVGFWICNTTDCYINKIIVIGYRMGFKSSDNSAGNFWGYCHTWNRPVNGSLSHAFWCGGINEKYLLCYADSPNDGLTNDCYGFYVDNNSNSIVSSFVYMSTQQTNGQNYGVDNKCIGIFCSANSGTGNSCIFTYNTFYGGNSSFRLKADFGGAFFAAIVVGNKNTNVVATQLDRYFLGFTMQSPGSTAIEFEVRDTGASFTDNITRLHLFPVGNNGSSSTVPGSTARATLSLFEKTSTTGAVGLEIWRGDGVVNSGIRKSQSITHYIRANGTSYFCNLVGRILIGGTTETEADTNCKLEVQGLTRLGNGTHAQGVKIGNIRMWTGTEAPTSGTYNQGDRVLNTAPTSGGFEGWICVASGTPGTWRTYGAIS
jgi:hypothetical protein